jgi:N-methylhydantoinase B
MDGDGIQPGPIPIALAMSVTGDRVRLDFSGTGPQVAGDINVVWLALLATAYYALKAILDPTIPANGGFYRAIEVEAPEGSIVNARPPAAVGWRSQTCQRIADVIFGALALAVPDRVPAAGNGANTAWTFAGTDPKTGRYYVYLETICGGGGALPDADGLDAIQVHTTNTSNLPVECLETEYPLLVEETSLVEGSGGEGRFRGGRGIRRTIEVRDHEAQFFATLERAEVAPWGLGGGGVGGRASLVLNPGTGGETLLPPKLWGHVLKAGDRVRLATPGGGGYGEADAASDRPGVA